MHFLRDLDDCGSIPKEAGAYISSGMFQKPSWEVLGGLQCAQKLFEVIKAVQGNVELMWLLSN